MSSKAQPIIKLSKQSDRNIIRHKQTLVASGILIINKKVLLIQRGPKNEPSPNEWGIPCGHVEQGEAPEEAAVREFFEETGIQVKDPELVGVETYFFDKDNIRIYITECIYAVHSQRKEICVTLDKEHVAYEFVPRDELKKFSSLLGPRKRIITKVLNK